MDVGVLLGFVGAALSALGIAVAWLLWVISEGRNARRRSQRAKETVLRELAVSLGEGRPPPFAVFQSTVRSVFRAENIVVEDPDLPLHEVVDDLMRQVTADPFLDPARRQTLQDQLLGLAATAGAFRTSSLNAAAASKDQPLSGLIPLGAAAASTLLVVGFLIVTALSSGQVDRSQIFRQEGYLFALIALPLAVATATYFIGRRIPRRSSPARPAGGAPQPPQPQPPGPVLGAAPDLVAAPAGLAPPAGPGSRSAPSPAASPPGPASPNGSGAP
jgi:hypothetical protein